MTTIRQLKVDGATHLRIDCEGCHAIKVIPFELLPAVRDEMDFADVARRFRCSECGTKPGAEAVTPWAQFMASGFQATFKAGG